MGKNSDLKRKLIQLYSALLYNAHIRGWVEGRIFTGSMKSVCVPGFNCYSCPGAIGACPLGSLQNALGSLNKNIGFYVFGIILLYGMLLGRTICGWLCPLGLIQELLHKIPTPKIPKSRFTRFLSYLKYVILVVFAMIIPICYGILKGIQVPGFCKFICPAGTSEGAMGLLPKNVAWLSMLGPIFTEKFVVMVIIGLACIFCYRSFCRFLCPLGAIYGMFNRIAVIGVKVDRGCCNNCGACVRNCKMDVAQVGDHECIHCGQCIPVCRQNALSFKVGKFSLPLKKSKEIVCWSIAIIVLVIAIVWSNFLDPSLENATYTKPVRTAEKTIGKKVSFTTTDLDGNTITSDEIFGKNEITLVNIWATWCGNCVGELNDLEKLNKSFASKNCAVVGLCGDADDKDTTDYAKALLKDEGAHYLNLAPYDGWYDDFDNGGAWPASFFVDNTGTMVAPPVIGANPKEYEKKIEDALNGNYSAIEGTSSNTCENKDGLYRIKVVSEDMTPIEGAMVQYCTDDTCKMAITDKDGVITFNDPPAEYEIHVRKLPKGYKEHTKTYKTEKKYSDMVIVIDKE